MQLPDFLQPIGYVPAEQRHYLEAHCANWQTLNRVLHTFDALMCVYCMRLELRDGFRPEIVLRPYSRYNRLRILRERSSGVVTNNRERKRLEVLAILHHFPQLRRA